MFIFSIAESSSRVDTNIDAAVNTSIEHLLGIELMNNLVGSLNLLN